MAGNAFVLVDDSNTGQQALDRAGDAQYIVIKFANGSYAAVKPGDLRTKLMMWKKLDIPLMDVPPNALAPYLVEAVEEDSADPAIKERLAHLKPNQVIVALRSGTVSGLFIGGVTLRGVTPTTHAKPPKKLTADDLTGKGVDNQGAEESAQPAEKRYINSEIHDAQDKAFDPTKTALKKDEVYSLIFDVDTKLRATAIAQKGVEFNYQYQEGEQRVTVTVRLESDDFEFLDEQEKKIIVPRTGKSLNKAAFLIQPKHTGECQVNAVFLKDGNFIQVIALRFFVGELFSAQTLGREVNAAFLVQPRNVSLTIINTGAAFQMILITPGTGATATIPLKLPELKDMAEQARQELLDLVNYAEGDQVFHQDDIDIPKKVGKLALQKLARAGFTLYQRIFFGPAADEQAKNLGRKLRQLAQEEKLKIQIFSQDFVLPWGILYMAERFDPNAIDPDLLLGLKHIIEHIPLQQNMQVTDNRIDGNTGLTVSLNVNTDIDKDMELPLVSKQLKYWEALKANLTSVKLIERTTKDEVTGALSDPKAPDQLLYFYCHGVSKDVDEKGGVRGSALVLSDNGRLTLDDLNIFAPTNDILPNAPLVFINACESAQLSPLVYDGFVPYFMAKGARGVIGTEVETPAIFAVEWANRFFDRFLKGETLGEIFLALRQEFFKQNANLMGLLYALYVDGDTRIEPALQG